LILQTPFFLARRVTLPASKANYLVSVYIAVRTGDATPPAAKP
jgi:hypothetical protein